MKRHILSACFFALAISAFAQKTETIYLSGSDSDTTVEWDFKCSSGMHSGKWSKIAVPSCWEMQGFGGYTYGRYYLDKNARPNNETGYYKYDFKVPAGWKDKKVEIVFEGVMTDATVRINGHIAGPEHQGGFTTFAYDISKLLNYGKQNRLDVTVEKESKDRSITAAERKADWWLFGGIYRPVYLRAYPKTHISHTAIDAKADGSVNIHLTTEGQLHGHKLTLSLDNDLSGQTIDLDNQPKQTVRAKFDDIKPWDPEHPNLYTLKICLTDAKGNTVHEKSERIGFRTIEFRYRNGFYLNGTKLQIKGVNRHCCYPETGRTTSHESDIKDARLIKGMNANAIRSHYPPDRSFLNICDSIGILYFNELPGWQNSYSTQQGQRILKEMVMQDVNHPSIFVWGNGNEGGFNYELDSMFAKYDPQKRHVVHGWALFDGVDAHHYPAYYTGVGRLHNGYQVFMPTEMLHAQYDKGAGTSLDEYWENYSKNPLFAGGFIWSWADEGIVRTDRNGEIDTDGPNGPDGIVGPHRELEGSWYTIRDVWSPIQIETMVVRNGFDGHFKVSNKHLFKMLSECRMTWQLLSAIPGQSSSVMTEGNVKLPDIAPGECGTAYFTLPPDFEDGDILKLTATSADGDTLMTHNYMLNYADEYYPKYHTIKTGLSSATIQGMTLKGGNITAVFNPDNGMLTCVTSHGKKLSFGNGPIPIGMKMKLQHISSRTDGNDALLVMHYQGAVDSIIWRMTPNGMLGMDAVILNDRRGKGYPEKFFDDRITNLGFSFSYPESEVTGMQWLGKGPYRVWRNRQRGTTYDVWHKFYNNTITGESTSRLIYPEFKGYHGNMYWASIESPTSPFTVYSETDGLYFRVFTPAEPIYRRNGTNTMQDFPEGDLSFLLEIPGMQSYKPIEQLGPQAQPSHIRINTGDDGLRIKLWFDFSAK